MPGLAAPGGNVQVSTYGNQPGKCIVFGWGGFEPSGNLDVHVSGIDAAGTPAFVPFTLHYVRAQLIPAAGR
jgi:hypothetical protein